MSPGNDSGDRPSEPSGEQLFLPGFRVIVWFLFGIILACSGFWIVIHNQPRYQGKRLNAWLDELTLSETGSVRRATAEHAIREMGAETLPHLVALLHRDPPLAGTKISEWIEEQPWVDFRFTPPPDRSSQVVEAFKVLGPVAGPALPKLAGLLGDGRVSGDVASCLAALGPPAVPVLTNALANTNRSVGLSALVALGEMGSTARDCIPAVTNLIETNNRFFANLCIRVLGQMGDSGKPLIPYLSALMVKSNYTTDAAFSLSQLGADGRVELMSRLTNSSRGMRRAAAAALEPDFHLATLARSRTQPDFKFGYLSRFYDQNLGTVESTFHQAIDNGEIACLLAPELASTNARVRAQACRLLASCGLRAAVATTGLSNTLADPDETVRAAAAATLAGMKASFSEGGIIRGPKDRKQIAFAFTGHEFAEGGETILDELTKHHGKASFFLTGVFLNDDAHATLVRRIVQDGHYLGPHSDQHLLYCPWDGPKKTLVSQEIFKNDLAANLLRIQRFGVDRSDIKYWLPAYEWYNQQIADWSAQQGLTVVNYTPGTRSNADYMPDGEKNFVASAAILESILKKERMDPDGLNGFILLLHIGSGPGRTDKMHRFFGALLDDLAGKGYQFVRMDELLQTN